MAMIICGSPAFFGLSRFMDANGDGLLFDLYPFIARARIGHGLDDAHVANAFFEVWTRPNAARGCILLLNLLGLCLAK